MSVHDVELRLSIPDGSFVQVAPADANCVLEHGNTVECEFGVVNPGGEIHLTVLITAPGSPGSITATAHWGAEHADPQFPTASLDVVPPSPDATSEWALPQGDTVTTDPGTGATTQNPQVTTAEVPATDIGTSTELSEADAAPGQFCAPYGDVLRSGLDDHHRPDVLARRIRCGSVFVLDKSEIPKGTKINEDPDVPRQRRRRELHRLFGVASPDPCVVSRKKLKKGDVQIVVLSSTNGRWRP